MRRFVLNRKEDKGGVSGTGVVAEGVEFKNGKVAISWLTKVSSVALYDSMADVETIHGHGGATTIDWLEDKHGKILSLLKEIPSPPVDHGAGHDDCG
jgi:hypothetical protein